MKRNNKKGFTIVELVIVIAVIAILSAVLIPTFGGITQKAQASAAKQEARNKYTEYYANDLSDGKIDGNADGEAMNVTGYEFDATAGTASFTVTGKDGKAYKFDGSKYYVDGVEETN